MEKLPKFYVGQRVVAVRDHSEGLFFKGQEFKVTGIDKSCCSWRISIGVTLPDRFYIICTTCRCGSSTIYAGGSEVKFSQSGFAPIHENFQAITFEKVMETELTSVN